MARKGVGNRTQSWRKGNRLGHAETQFGGLSKREPERRPRADKQRSAPSAHPFLLREPQRALVYLDLVWQAVKFFLYLFSLLPLWALALLSVGQSLDQDLGGEQARGKGMNFCLGLTTVRALGGRQGEDLAPEWRGGYRRKRFALCSRVCGNPGKPRPAPGRKTQTGENGGEMCWEDGAGAMQGAGLVGGLGMWGWPRPGHQGCGCLN